MNLKTLFRTLVFLAILFVMLDVGMNNPQSARISLWIPSTGLHSSSGVAAAIYFVTFAIGVLAGTMLHGGKGGGRSKSKD